MEGKTEFFSASHKRLLNIATWARYLAWVALIIYTMYALGTFNQSEALYKSAGLFQGSSARQYSEYLVQNPSLGIKLILDILQTVLQGVIYFLILKGVSFGFNMIVETDINYREKREGRHE